jgi:hypothetical protein
MIRRAVAAEKSVVGTASHCVGVAALPDGPDCVREFPAFAQGLRHMVTWLRAYNDTTVAMESTGISWVPLNRSKLASSGRDLAHTGTSRLAGCPKDPLVFKPS